jgi:iron(III) transport system substrate-binding protein
MKVAHTGALLLAAATWLFAIGCTPPAPSPTAPPASKPAAATAPAAAPAAKTGDDSRTQALYEAAKKEGKVVGYYGDLRSAADGPQGLIAAFEKRYPGVKVELTYGSGSQSREKILAEAGSGRHLGDVMSGGSDTIEQLAREGVMEAYRSPVEQDGNVLVDPKLSDASTTQFRALVYGITYNTSLVPADKAPSGWKDLLDPFWKDKLSMQDPEQGTGGGFSLFIDLWLHPEFGQAYWNGMGKQNMFRAKGSGPLLQAVARGEKAATITDHSGNYREVKDGGAPVAFVKAREGVQLTLLPMAIIKGAPHPNAARLWIDWSISEEAQQILSNSGFTPLRKGIKPAFPEASLEGANFFPHRPAPTQAELDEWVPRVKDVFGS